MSIEIIEKIWDIVENSLVWRVVKNSAEVGGCISLIVIAIDLLKKFKAKRLKARRQRYLAGIMSTKYIEWEKETLKSLYVNQLNEGFIKVGEREFPVITRQGDQNIEFPFDRLTNKSELIIDSLIRNKKEIDHEINSLPHYKSFSNIVKDQVQRPDLYGYTNRGIRYDERGYVIGFVAVPRTYKETVFSCHNLQYELWKAYQKKRRGARILHPFTEKKQIKIGIASLNNLPLRKKIHKKNTEKDIVFNGLNRSSLVDINVAILLKENGVWKIAVGPRSQEVATFPGYWSIIPSGGFELYEKTIIPEDIKNNKDFENKLKENFKFKYSLYREYLEEVFNLEDYEQPLGHDDIRHLESNSHIQFIKDKIGEGSIHFVFLGVCFNLIVLRQTFSFALFIDNDRMEGSQKWPDEAIRHNQENTEIKMRRIEDVEEDLLNNSDSPLMVELPATFDLLKKCKYSIDNEVFTKTVNLTT